MRLPLELPEGLWQDAGMPEPAASFPPQVTLVLGHFALPFDSIHGINHWGRVLENGLRLAPLTGADPLVVALFAVFHDACRLNDGGDWNHGPRAAQWLKSLDLGITAGQRRLLAEACEGHTQSFQSNDPTIGTCWDADRLDLGRVERMIDPFYLSTTAARDPPGPWDPGVGAAAGVPCVGSGVRERVSNCQDAVNGAQDGCSVIDAPLPGFSIAVLLIRVCRLWAGSVASGV